MNYKHRKGISFGRLILLVLVFGLITFLLASCVSTTGGPSVASENVSQTAQAGNAEDDVPQAEPSPGDTNELEPELLLDEEGIYTSKEDVSLYIHLYGKLPSNFITKKQAQELGWSGGSLEQYAPGKCIGGSHFGNYEGLLPAKDGRVYAECDIDTLGATNRGAKRIVFSNDGLIYFTDDHYESFAQLYGDDGT